MRHRSLLGIVFRNLEYLSILSLVLFFTTNCKNKIAGNHWEDIITDPKISKNIIYSQLDKQPEIFSVGEEQDSLAKRTSDVAYFWGEKINQADTNYSKIYNCRAYLFHDTLSINIGFGHLFGGWGFIISCHNRKFDIRPYFVTDIVYPDAPKPSFKVVYQRLTLNKLSYKLGDSLYGKVDFKIIEATRNQNPVQHLAKGYFRTKTKKPWWRSP